MFAATHSQSRLRARVPFPQESIRWRRKDFVLASKFWRIASSGLLPTFHYKLNVLQISEIRTFLKSTYCVKRPNEKLFPNVHFTLSRILAQSHDIATKNDIIINKNTR